MAAKTDSVVRLKSGLNLGYAEYGVPDGRPVMMFHGLPSSRLETGAPPEHGRILAEAIPQASYEEYPKDGHSLFIGHVEEFLSTVF